MVCKSCGKALRSGEKFCTVCGCYNDYDEEPQEENDTKEELDNLGESIKELEKELEDANKRERIREEKRLEKERIKEEKRLEKEEKEREKQLEKEEKENTEIEEEVVEISIREDKNKKSKEEELLDNLTHEERPLAIFIGEDYKWIAQRPFNVFAMLFSWIYFLYRKVYLIGIIGLVVTGLIIRFAPILTIPIIVISMIGIGFLFNKVYLNIAKNRVAKIESKYQDQYTCEKMLRKKGGVNAFTALLIFLIALGLFILSYFNFGALKKTSKYDSSNSENIANCRSIGRQVYQNIEVYQVEGELKEAACEVKTAVEKEYKIYFVLTKDNNEIYTLFETGNGLVSLKANTAMIDKLTEVEKQYGLANSDKEFLKASNEVRNNYQKTLADAKEEDKRIKNNKDEKEKTHFILTKDDIIG